MEGSPGAKVGPEGSSGLSPTRGRPGTLCFRQSTGEKNYTDRLVRECAPLQPYTVQPLPEVDLDPSQAPDFFVTQPDHVEVLLTQPKV